MPNDIIKNMQYFPDLQGTKTFRNNTPSFYFQTIIQLPASNKKEINMEKNKSANLLAEV